MIEVEGLKKQIGSLEAAAVALEGESEYAAASAAGGAAVVTQALVAVVERLDALLERTEPETVSSSIQTMTAIERILSERGCTCNGQPPGCDQCR